MINLFVVLVAIPLLVLGQDFKQLNSSFSPGSRTLYTKSPSGAITSKQFHSRPTVLAKSNFNPSDDVAVLLKAMEGIGTDEDALIEILCKRPISQRKELPNTYKINYGEDLIDDIKSETGGTFRGLLLLLLEPVSTIDLYTSQIHEAFSGPGTDEAALLDILPVLTNMEMKQVKSLYQEKYGKSLVEDLNGELSNEFLYLMVSLTNATRDESKLLDKLTQTTLQAIATDDLDLRNAMKNVEGIDDAKIVEILTQRSFDQIRAINQEYKVMTGTYLEDDIEAHMNGDYKNGLIAVLRYALDQTNFFAYRLRQATKGVGTDNKSLNRIIVTRSEIDMENIKDEYERAYGETLRTAIGGDTRGDYKHALYTLIGERKEEKMEIQPFNVQPLKKPAEI